ncbi:MAG: hypothetical protein H6718_04085 [Polyangiaceae bacterium]|nr:hypothetical protein [Polyangiaceae bacterium]
MAESRLLDALKALVDGLTAATKLHVPVRYRVVTPNGDDRFNLQCVTKGPWPDVLPISVRMGVPGAVANLKLGSIVLVSFVEGDASMPVITHFSTTEEAGWAPVSLRFEADEIILGDPVTSAGRGVARVGDVVGFLAVSTGSTKTRCE